MRSITTGPAGAGGADPVGGAQGGGGRVGGGFVAGVDPAERAVRPDGVSEAGQGREAHGRVDGVGRLHAAATERHDGDTDRAGVDARHRAGSRWRHRVHHGAAAR